MQFNTRAHSIPLSATLALDARAKELIADGRDIINMTAGEPDFDAPAAVRDAARAFVDSGKVRYTPAPGRVSLRETIAGHLSRTRGVTFDAKQVTVCHSAKHALSGTILSLVSEGDEVLLLLPAWVSYFEMVRFAGGEPVTVPCRADLGPDLEAIAAAVTGNTRGIMINSPCNPSGYCFTSGEMQALCDLCKERDLWILSDEIYSRMIYDGTKHESPVTYGDDARARTILVDGASKAFAMTGYRIGFLAADTELSGTVGRLHSQLTGAPNAISQEAFECALAEEPVEVADMVAEFDRRRHKIVSGLEALGLPCEMPKGAFYVFPDISAHLDENGSMGFCERLLEEAEVASVPGSAFGTEGHVRLSYALAEDQITEALERLGRFLGST
jgi:aspartate aminotransferase